MELVCAKHLIEFGYTVDVEDWFDILVCDVFASKGDGEAIVEIETGFIPPEHALDQRLIMLQELLARSLDTANMPTNLSPTSCKRSADPKPF